MASNPEILDRTMRLSFRHIVEMGQHSMGIGPNGRVIITRHFNGLLHDMMPAIIAEYHCIAALPKPGTARDLTA